VVIAVNKGKPHRSGAVKQLGEDIIKLPTYHLCMVESDDLQRLSGLRSSGESPFSPVPFRASAAAW
jgi:hypothetical protein